MGIKEILVGLFRGKSGKDGIWDFLGKRSSDRRLVDLKKVQNEGTQKLIPLLQPGMVLIEGGEGWFREIRMPQAAPPGVLLTAVTPLTTIPSLPADELEPARWSELEPGSPNEAEQAPRQAQGPADEP